MQALHTGFCAWQAHLLDEILLALSVLSSDLHHNTNANLNAQLHTGQKDAGMTATAQVLAERCACLQEDTVGPQWGLACTRAFKRIHVHLRSHAA